MKLGVEVKQGGVYAQQYAWQILNTTEGRRESFS